MTLVDRARIIILVVAPALLFQISTARAQSAEAEALFRDGRALIKQGQLATGCDKLAASARLEPSVGTLLNLGDCREKQGKLATAWGAFRRAEAMAKQSGNSDRRQAEASRRAGALEPKLSTLRIDIAARIDGLVVHRDDEIVDAAAWSSPVPVDPGTYAIRAEAPGFVAWHQSVVVADKAQRQVVLVPSLDRAPVRALVRAPIVPVKLDTPPPVTYVTTHRSRTWSAARELSLGFAIAGVGALGTGLYFGDRANDLRDQANQRCPLTVCVDPQGLRDNSQARTDANRANILYAAGGASVVTAVVLWLAGAPSDETIVRPTFGDRQAGVSLAGSF